ncbi:MAG: thioredoxin-disulfide reductase [Chitinophagaceae bacterium]
MSDTRCLIIGSGPAGYTAAIYSARANLNPLLFQGLQPGGQLTTTSEVENFPGFPNPILGIDLMDMFEKQARNVGAEIHYGSVTNVDFSKRPFEITIDNEKKIITDTLIIATGASAKWLGLEDETRLKNKGVSACAVCDGFFFKGKEVAVIGGGDSALEEALYLAKLCTHVHLLVRNIITASKVMQDRILKVKNITTYLRTDLIGIQGIDKVEAINIKNKDTKEEKNIAVGGCFIAIGHQPNTELFKEQLKMDELGYIITEKGSTHTSVEGVFAAGDVQDRRYRQAITSAGTGCMAALDAEKYLTENNLI